MSGESEMTRSELVAGLTDHGTVSSLWRAFRFVAVRRLLFRSSLHAMPSWQLADYDDAHSVAFLGTELTLGGAVFRRYST